MSDKEIANKIVFKPADGEIKVEVMLDEDTVWLTQKQMALLFGKDRRTITDHIRNVFEEAELSASSVSRNFRLTASDGKIYNIKHYNLDVIISVGYRVKSLQGTQFRIWATNVLRNHLVKGYTLNETRLTNELKKYQDLQREIELIDKVRQKEITSDQTKSLLELVTFYSKSLSLLESYDTGNIKISSKKLTKSKKSLNYDNLLQEINSLRANLKESELFGNERDKGLESVLLSISQSFGGADLYPSVEEKAANLLYLIIKNHPFSDGNKRIGSLVFLKYLESNKLLFNTKMEPSIDENTIVAIALMIAESNPKDKNLLVNIVVNLIGLKN